jgi:predicted DCC family thiol-disulfide oxidoreductase YuxK
MSSVGNDYTISSPAIPTGASIRSAAVAVFALDLRSLALMRVLLGGVLLWDLLHRFADLSAFYSDAGLAPRDWVTQADTSWHFSLYFANGSAGFAALLMAIQSLVAIGFIFGWRTRLMTVVSFVMWGWLCNRNPIILSGGDLLVACLLFWSCFLPMSSRFSIDAALSPAPPSEENTYLSWATAGLIIQVLSVYFYSAILKNGAEWTHDFTAVYYTMMIDRFASPLGQWLLLPFPLAMKALTVFVWWLEMIGPAILLLAPLFGRTGVAARAVMLVCFISLHLGFALFMQVGHFPYVCFAGLSSLVGAWFWNWALKASRTDIPVSMYYDHDCGFCRKMCQLFRSFLGLQRAAIAPAQSHSIAGPLLEANNSWVVIDHEGRPFLKWQAFVQLLKVSPIFRLLYRPLNASWLRRPGTAAYDFVARNRDRFAYVSARVLPERQERFDLDVRVQRLAGVAIAVITIWNFATIDAMPQSIVSVIRPAVHSLRIEQYWAMFAPYPMKGDGWFVIEGILDNGEKVDVLNPDKAPTRQRPRHTSDTYPNSRWNKYQLNLLKDEDFPDIHLQYGRYLCRTWNGREANPGRLLNTFTITYMIEISPPPGEPQKVEPIELWTHQCFAGTTDD